MNSPKPDTTSREALRDYLKQVRRGHELVAQEERKRLRTFDYRANLASLKSLLDLGYRNIKPQPICGYVELHRLLKRHEARRE